MINLVNAFTFYEGISLMPHNLTCFIILPINFILTLSEENSTIYTLSKFTLTSSSFILLSSSFMHITLTFKYEYSQKDLRHTMHTSYYTYQLIFAWTHPSKPTTLSTEDLFAYALNPKQIYTSLLLFIISD